MLRQRERKGLVTPADIAVVMTRILAGVVTRIPAGDIRLDIVDQPGQLTLSTRALDFAHRFNLPAAYDAHYLALAEHAGCEYWTADERLWNAVKAQLPWVRWLGEARPTPQLATPSTP